MPQSGDLGITIAEYAELGRALHRAMLNTDGEWPLTLNIHALKTELSATRPDGKEAFRIKVSRRWL